MKLLPKDQDWTVYAWLVYLVYFLLFPFLAGAPAWQCNAAMAGRP